MHITVKIFYLCMCVCVDACACMRACMFVCACVQMHVELWVYECNFEYAQMYMCVCLSVLANGPGCKCMWEGGQVRCCRGRPFVYSYICFVRIAYLLSHVPFVSLFVTFLSFVPGTLLTCYVMPHTSITATCMKALPCYCIFHNSCIQLNVTEHACAPPVYLTRRI